jgi:hydrogenase-4 membrane subunit HyfE
LGAMVALLIAWFLRLKTDKGAIRRSKCGFRRSFVQFDPAGSVLMIAAVCCLLLAMQWGGQSLPWASPKIIVLFALSGVLLAVFVFVERKMGDDAIVPFAILKKRSIAFGTVYLFLFSMPNFAVSKPPAHTETWLMDVVRGLHSLVLPSGERLHSA